MMNLASGVLPLYGRLTKTLERLFSLKRRSGWDRKNPVCDRVYPPSDWDHRGQGRYESTIFQQFVLPVKIS